VSEEEHKGEQPKTDSPTRSRDQAEKATEAFRKRYEQYKNTCTDAASRTWRWWGRQLPERRLTLIFEFVIAFATLVYACVAMRQLSIMRTTLEVSERAWIVLKEVHSFNLEPDKESFVEVIMENVGHTPATSVVVLTGSQMMRKLDRFEPTYGKLTERPSRGVIGPGHPQVLHVPVRALAKELVDASKAGDLVLYVFGHMQYGDLTNPGRDATFCVYWVPKTTDFNVCETYNDSP